MDTWINGQMEPHIYACLIFSIYGPPCLLWWPSIVSYVSIFLSQTKFFLKQNWIIFFYLWPNILLISISHLCLSFALTWTFSQLPYVIFSLGPTGSIFMNWIIILLTTTIIIRVKIKWWGKHYTTIIIQGLNEPIVRKWEGSIQSVPGEKLN